MAILADFYLLEEREMKEHVLRNLFLAHNFEDQARIYLLLIKNINQEFFFL